MPRDRSETKPLAEKTQLAPFVIFAEKPREDEGKSNKIPSTGKLPLYRKTKHRDDDLPTTNAKTPNDSCLEGTAEDL